MPVLPFASLGDTWLPPAGSQLDSLEGRQDLEKTVGYSQPAGEMPACLVGWEETQQQALGHPPGALASRRPPGSARQTQPGQLRLQGLPPTPPAASGLLSLTLRPFFFTKGIFTGTAQQKGQRNSCCLKQGGRGGGAAAVLRDAPGLDP